jgi:hypothetical protein
LQCQAGDEHEEDGQQDPTDAGGEEGGRCASAARNEAVACRGDGDDVDGWE